MLPLEGLTLDKVLSHVLLHLLLRSPAIPRMHKNYIKYKNMQYFITYISTPWRLYQFILAPTLHAAGMEQQSSVRRLNVG